MQPAPITTSRDIPPAAAAAAAPLEAPDAAPSPPVQGANPGQPPGVGRHPVITFPVLGTFYPQRALRAREEGAVTATCVVTLAALAGYGFGDATIKAPAKTQVQVVFRHGVETPQVLRIPVNWRPPQPTAANPASSQPAG